MSTIGPIINSAAAGSVRGHAAESRTKTEQADASRSEAGSAAKSHWLDDGRDAETSADRDTDGFLGYQQSDTEAARAETDEAAADRVEEESQDPGEPPVDDGHLDVRV